MTSGPMAAVVPARGDLNEDESKALTSEVRAQLRGFDFVLGTQQPVREAAERIAPSGLPSASQLAEIALSVQAEVIFAVLVVAAEPSLQVVGFDLRRGAHRGVAASLPQPPAGGYTKEIFRAPLHACFVALTKKPADPAVGLLPEVRRLDLSGLGPGVTQPEIDPYAAPAATVTAQPELPATPAADDRWKKWNHEGFFMDLGFVLSYAFGDTLCRDAEKGLGGRFRVGYRFFEMFALSLSASGAAHEIPKGSIQDMASVDRFFFWAGVFGGLRFHPVRKFVIDPFIGLDLGWTWMMHFSKVADGELPDISALSPEEQQKLQDLMGKRITLTMQGFTLVPQAGLRIFLAPGFALGVAVEWQIPFYSRVCASATTATVENQGVTTLEEKCGDPATAGVLTEDIGYDLTKSSELPKFLTAEFGLSFVF